MIYGTPSNSLGMRRYEFFCQTTQPKILGHPNQYLQVDPKSEKRNTIHTGYMCTFEEYPRKKIKYEVCRRDMRCKEELGSIFGSKGVQEEFSWSFKGAL
jgi:hypothetical protein